ncbi:MAG: recombinase family protein [Paludibacteraceae bacterium]|nr:recombinase family protein [Paludibacteraceae bacterium]
MKKVITPYKDLVEKVAGAFIRVSSYGQEDKGSSLETQKDMCRKFAAQNNIRIKKFFCDTHESAKTPGEYFKNMIEEALKDDEINIILVQNLDRFSRNVEGIVAREILKANWKYLISTTQQFDPDTPEGDLMSDISILFAKYNNDVRQCKTLFGQHGQLGRGEWPYRIPCGYVRNPSKRQEIWIDNFKGNLMKQAFLWRAEGVQQVVICERLKALGLNMQPKHLSKLLKNPFYCGWIIHRNLDNMPKKGIHPTIIDEETFFAINEEMRHRIYGTPEEWNYLDEIGANKDRVTKMEPEYPLKRLLHCPQCGKALTGYATVRLSKVHHYYKCNTKGCCLNLNADDLHQKFNKLISQYQLNPKFIPLFKKILSNEVRTRIGELAQNLPQLRKRYSELEQQKKNVQLNYAKGKINEDIYQEALSQVECNLKILDEQIYTAEQAERESEEITQYVVEKSKNLIDLIRQADYKDRLRLQTHIFPEGLIVDTNEGLITYKIKKLCPIYKKIA